MATLLSGIQDILMECGRGRPSVTPTDAEGIHATDCIRHAEREMWEERWKFLFRYDEEVAEAGGTVTLPTGFRLASNCDYYADETGQLFNVDDSEAVTATVTVDLIKEIPFEEMQAYAGELLKSRAAAMYHRIYVPMHENREWQVTQSYLEQRVMKREGDARAEESRRYPTNLRRADTVNRVVGRRAGRRTPRA